MESVSKTVCSLRKSYPLLTPDAPPIPGPWITAVSAQNLGCSHSYGSLSLGQAFLISLGNQETAAAVLTLARLGSPSEPATNLYHFQEDRTLPLQQANADMVGSAQFPTLGCQTLFRPSWSILEGAGRANTEPLGCAEWTVLLLQVHNQPEPVNITLLGCLC